MACASGKGACALHMPAQRQRSRPRYASACVQSSKLCAHERYAQMVELADTLDSGSSAKAWGFKSPSGHFKGSLPGAFFIARKPHFLLVNQGYAAISRIWRFYSFDLL